MIKNILIAFFFISISLTAFAQEQHLIITGKVVDRNTKAPLAAASVFAQNTTFGVATDAMGSFRLKLPAGGYVLIITFTGYETETIRLTAGSEINNLEIELKPRERSLEEVSIVSSNEVKDGWQKYGSFFTDNFIGKSEFSSQTRIKNPEVLKFYFSKKRNRLKVLATEPLFVVNDALGYNLRFTIDSFTHEYITNTTLFVGYPLFEEMNGSTQQASFWKENRHKAYNGSLLHFMRSYFDKTLSKEGFEIQFLVKNKEDEKTIQVKNPYAALNYDKDDSTNTVELFPNQPDIIVIYKFAKPQQAYVDSDPKAKNDFQASVLTISPDNSIIIEQNGYYFEQSDLIINGYWNFEKIGDMLPYNYRRED